MKNPFLLIALIIFCQHTQSQEIFTLKNESIQIQVKKAGAELCAIKLLKNGKDYMWDANPAYWSGTSPILFPIVGGLKEGSYVLDGKKYSMKYHGFFSKNPNVKMVSSTANSLTFMLRYNKETLVQYPFEFELYVTFTINKNTIEASHEVKNLDNKEMYFSLGLHPAFKCPLDSSEKYSDYYLEFEKPETAYTYRIDLASGLLDKKVELVLDSSRYINLTYQTFNKGALIFKGLQSKSVSLCSKISGKRVQVDYAGFPYLGFWSMPNANYVCIEPWYGINQTIDAGQDFKTKEGIVKLGAKSSFKAAYTIRIF